VLIALCRIVSQIEVAMKINQNHLLEIEPGDPWNYRFDASPNSKPGLQPAQLILYATGYASVGNAVFHFKKTDGKSVHLLLGKDGLELVQMVPFNRRAMKIANYDSTSIGMALDYNPSSKDQPDADPRSYLEVIAVNNKPDRVALYSKGQLDALLELAVFLQGALGLTKFLSNDEILVGSAYPGPAFPLTIFREKLFERTGGKMGSKIVLEELAEPAVLRNSPDLQGAPLTSQPLPKGTPLSISAEWRGWARVEVMQEVESNPWLIGWVEGRKVQSGMFTPVVVGDRLGTVDGRLYKFIPAIESNYDTRTEVEPGKVKFVIMHATTGTHSGSTINYFRSPSSGVSAHLVIGRDGRVVQMVPFNRAAFHAGSGSWEGQGQINWHSIGIEMDNAGKLIHKKDGTYVRRGTIIPEDQVKWKRYWKERKARPWHKFTPIQCKVTEAVVKALAEHFSLEAILEHDRLSLRNRSDPGPLFITDKLRKNVMGEPRPKFRLFRVKQGIELELYENACYDSPELDVPILPRQLPECVVEVLKGNCDYWTKIKVFKCEQQNFVGKSGWVRKDDVKFWRVRESDRVRLYNMTRKQDFYKDRGANDKPPSLVIKTLASGTPVRKVKDSNGWSLVAAPEHTVDRVFLEGWVRTEGLEKVTGVPVPE
jgi:N-acetyl-anhydromuramyl-L-alanine amidase AmpD